MDKEYFLRELSYLLSDMADEEREEALEYYRDYFEEAGDAHESEVLARLGSPEKVAAEIRFGLEKEAAEGGEFSERGYRDERFAEDHRVPDKYTGLMKQETSGGTSDQGQEAGEEARAGRRDGAWEDRRTGSGPDHAWEDARTDRGGNTWENGRQGQDHRWERQRQYWEDRKRKREYTDAKYDRRDQTWKENRRNGLLVLLLFIVFGLPLMGTVVSAGFSILFGIIGGIFGIFGGLLGVAAGAAGMMVGLLAGGVGMIISGIMNMDIPAVGMMGICLGFLSLSGGVLSLLLVRWLFTTVVPGVFRFCIQITVRGWQWLAGFIKRLFQGIFGRGGAAE